MDVKPCPVCSYTQSGFERTLNGIDLFKCSRCTFVYANVGSGMIVDANFIYEEDSETHGSWNKSVVDLVWFKNMAERFTRVMGPGKVLDVGCGQGDLLNYFKQHGWEIYGIDPSPWARKFAELYGFKLYQGTLEDSGIDSDAFDLVLSTSTLEHIESPFEHVMEIVRVLKPGGGALFTGIPNYNKITRPLKSTYTNNSPPGHVNYFTLRSMRYLFSHTEIGGSLSEVSVKTYGLVGAPQLYQFLLKLMPGSKKNASNAPSAVSDQGNSAAEEMGPEHRDSPKLMELLAKGFIALNFYFGRIIGLGDKLQVEITKRAQPE